MLKAYFHALRRFADIEGRARRRDYWYFIFMHLLISVTIALSGDYLFEINYPYIIYNALMLLPAMTIAIRRLHDTGRSGWWMLIGLVPLAGPIILFIYLSMCGEASSNRWGTNPKLDFTVGH